MRKLGVYIHIPFCVRKCLYCDFLSAVASKEVQEQYLQALLREMEEEAVHYKEYEADTVFIGGGTPSLPDAVWIEDILCKLKEKYKVAERAEITIEVNPGTVNEEKLRAYRKAGVNRLSIGLQSASDEELKALGRIHDYKTFTETYHAAVRAGFTNINVDIMAALPGQSKESYLYTLRQVTALVPKPVHISAYSLIIEEGTPFYDKYGQGAEQAENAEPALPSEEEERAMYELTKEYLADAGYERYEISNYAFTGFACAHNIGYWTGKEYVGFGMGAASYVNQTRFCNTGDREAYIRGENPRQVQSLTVTEQMEEFMFLGLRMTAGVNENEFYRRFGISIEEVYGNVLQKNEKDGLLVHGDGQIYLTDRGVDVSNYVMAQFLQ